MITRSLNQYTIIIPAGIIKGRVRGQISKSQEHVVVDRNLKRVKSRVLPIVSGLYGIFLLWSTGSDGSVFSILTSISIFVVIRSITTCARTFSIFAPILSILSSAAHLALSIFVNARGKEVRFSVDLDGFLASR